MKLFVADEKEEIIVEQYIQDQDGRRDPAMDNYSGNCK